jgi:serine/threonine protein kinase
MKLQISYQAAVGMNFLHQSSPPIIHRDLKSHNILLDDKYNAKISDFGITRFKEVSKVHKKEWLRQAPRLTYFQQGNKKQNIAEKTNSLGTIYWTAPEVLDGYEASEKSDCYSFGIVLWEVFHMKDPYVGKDPLAVADQVLNKGLRPLLDPHLPEEILSMPLIIYFSLFYPYNLHFLFRLDQILLGPRSKTTPKFPGSNGDTQGNGCWKWDHIRTYADRDHRTPYWFHVHCLHGMIYTTFICLFYFFLILFSLLYF